MSAREVLDFRLVYGRIAAALDASDQSDHAVPERRAWDTLEAIGLRVDDAVAAGKSIGAAYLCEFKEWMGR